MGIRIMGMPDTSHLRQVAAVRYKDDLVKGSTPCEADFFSNKAFLGFYGSSRCNRPYLCLMGTVTAVRGEFPQNISEVVLDEPIQAAFVYDFSADELADMCRKGLFTPGFRCPDIFENNEWQGLPIPSCSYSMIPGDEQSAPVIFVGVDKAFDLPLDQSCGYVAGSYFEQAEEKQPDYQEDGDYTDRLHREDDAEDEAAKRDPLPAYTDAKTAAKALQTVDSLDDMTNSVIMSNPHLRAAYENMQASVKAKLGTQAAQKAMEADGDSGREAGESRVDFRAKAAARETLDNYSPDAREADAAPDSVPEPRPEMRPISGASSGDDKEYE